MSVNKRQSNYELLRIAAMIFITFNHITTSGNTISNEITPNTFISLFFMLGGKFGTNLFVFISVWFLADSKFKFERIFRIWAATLFYSVLLNIVDVVIFHYPISGIGWIRAFLPCIGRYYWYCTAYIIMLFVIPILNTFIKNIDNKKLLSIILFGGILTTILPVFTFNGKIFDSMVLRMIFKLILWGPVWFSYVYCTALYIKKNNKLKRLSGSAGIAIFFASYLLTYVIETILYCLGVLKNNSFLLADYHYSNIRDMSSILCVLSAFGFFVFFKNLKIPYNRVINKIGGLVFGAYMFQCHTNSIEIIWQRIFKFPEMCRTEWFVPYSIFAVVIIMSIGILIEYFRTRFIEAKILNSRYIMRFISACQHKLEKLYDSTNKIVLFLLKGKGNLL